MNPAEATRLAVMCGIGGFLGGACFMDGVHLGFTLDHYGGLSLALGAWGFVAWLLRDRGKAARQKDGDNA
jgi:hypothetical protein